MVKTYKKNNQKKRSSNRNAHVTHGHLPDRFMLHFRRQSGRHLPAGFTIFSNSDYRPYGDQFLSAVDHVAGWIGAEIDRLRNYLILNNFVVIFFIIDAKV